jgi:glutathione S-transferase
MVDSETARLILGRYRIAYIEEPHAFGWGSILALLHAGSIQVPALYGDGLKLLGPRPLVDHFDPGQPLSRALLPTDPALRRGVEDDWTLYNGTLATRTAQLAYYHLLPRKGVMLEAFTRGIPPAEAAFGSVVYPLQRALLRLLLKLTDANARAALDEIRTIFDRTDKRIVDGREFLLGDTLTLGDIALAAAAAPVLLPERSASPIPPLDRMPPAYSAIIVEMREHPTAKFVQGIFTVLR